MVVEHPIIDVRTDGNLVFVITDYSDFPPEYRANNLECYDHHGKTIWCASSPVNSATSAYTDFISVTPDLIVGNFAGFDATIDKNTGAVITSQFTK